MSTISLCMIVKDEEVFLPKCLSSVKDIVDEIIIVDTGSKDNTIKIAKSFGAIVYQIIWNGSFAYARNYALEKATGQWILILDADEELNQETEIKIKKLIIKKDIEAYFFKVRSFINLDNKLEYIDDLRLSFFRNRKEYRYQGNIHEDIVNCIRNKGNNIEVTDICINHYGYLPEIWYKKNKTERNIKIIRKVLEKENNIFLRYSLGAEYMGIAQYDNALKEFLKVASLWDSTIVYYSDLLKKISVCFYFLLEYEKAINTLEQAIYIYPDFTDLWFILGQCNIKLENYYQGEFCFRKCLDLGKTPLKYMNMSGVDSYLSILEIVNIKLKMIEKIKKLR